MVCSSPCFTATPDAAGCHGVVDRDAPTPRVGRRLLEHAVRRCMGRAWSAWIAHTGCLHATGLAAALWHARTRSHAHSHASTNLRPASNRGDSHEDFLNVKCRMTLLVTDENGGFKQRAGSLTISSPALHGWVRQTGPSKCQVRRKPLHTQLLTPASVRYADTCSVCTSHVHWPVPYGQGGSIRSPSDVLKTGFVGNRWNPVREPGCVFALRSTCR